ncbi:MAG TPA: rhomboid family intramembrane serine protease [Opitutaceae bacterium]|nr:rhomboid family intramembrane serine protease [Opitutaceae bacterium]
MLSDRPYLRDDYPRERTSVLIWLISAIVAGFILQFLLGSLRPNFAQSLTDEFGLTIPGLRDGRVWTLLTHGFLHSEVNLFHIGANLLALYFIGRELLPILGTRRFLALYFGASLAGGLVWALAHWQTGGTFFGATAAVDALLVVFACFFPHRRHDFLFFFVPVSLKPKYLALGLLAFDLFGLFIHEIRNLALPFGFSIGHSAHLGGMFAGWIYFRYLHGVPWTLPALRASNNPPNRDSSDRSDENVTSSATHAGIPTPGEIRAEVDRILDKINSHGFPSLTPDEKRLLDEAKDLLSRR